MKYDIRTWGSGDLYFFDKDYRYIIRRLAGNPLSYEQSFLVKRPDSETISTLGVSNMKDVDGYIPANNLLRLVFGDV